MEHLKATLKTLDRCNVKRRKQGYTTIRKASVGDGNIGFDGDAHGFVAHCNFYEVYLLYLNW